jgi:hypothetical protein
MSEETTTTQDSPLIQVLSAVVGGAATANPALALILTLIVREVPALAIELVRILSKPEVTEADWEALEARYRGKKAADFYRA